MESIADLLNRRRPEEPDELKAVKQFVLDNFNANANVALQNNNLIITVSSAALANTLRLRSLQIKKECKTTKRLVFRIV